MESNNDIIINDEDLQNIDINKFLYLGNELEEKLKSKMYDTRKNRDKDMLRKIIRYSIFDLKYGKLFKELRKKQKLPQKTEQILDEIEDFKNRYYVEETKKSAKIFKDEQYYFNEKDDISDVEEQSFIETQFKKNKNYLILMNDEISEIYKLIKFFTENKDLIKSKKENLINDENVIEYLKNNAFSEGLYQDVYHDILEQTRKKFETNNNIYFEEEELNLSNKVTFWYNFLQWLSYIFSNEIPHYFKSNSDLSIKKDKNLNIIPVYSTGHASAIIVDNVNKKILFFEPNGSPREYIDAFKGVKSKEEILKKIFSSEDYEFLKKNNYEFINAIDSSFSKSRIFDKQIEHNGIMTEGKCGIATMTYIKTFIKKYNKRKKYNYKVEDYVWFLKDIAQNQQTTKTRMQYSQLCKIKKLAREKYKESFNEFEKYNKKIKESEPQYNLYEKDFQKSINT